MNAQNPPVTITHKTTGTGGVYTAKVEGKSAPGYLEWEARADGARIAAHTVVPRAIGGRGIAGLLVDQLIADARRLGVKVVPQCSYVAAKFDRNPNWSDLRA